MRRTSRSARRIRLWGRPLAAVTLVAAMLMLSTGCGTVKVTGTARTGTEQLLLTNAWDSALQKVDFRPLTGVPVFLDVSNINTVDQGWVVSSLRQALLAHGVLLREKREQAQWIVEARVGAYGTDEESLLIGIPQVTVPPTVTGMPTGTLPKIPLAERSNQSAVTKMALFAFDRASGQMVWTSGTMLATATAKDVYIGGLGPIQSGTIRDGPEFVGIKLPKLPEPPPPSSASASRRPGTRAASPYPMILLPASAADLDNFAP